MVAVTRKSDSTRIGVSAAAVKEVVKVLAHHNPHLSKPALTATGKIVAAVSAATARLSIEQQKEIVAHDQELVKAVEVAMSSLAGMSKPERTKIALPDAVEESQGAGMGALLDIEEGRRRLSTLAVPTSIEDWAGPVAGPGEIERIYRTKRSTLHDWQKRGAVIGLLKGERKHVFPLAQFVDGRPIRGMTEVTKIIRNPRAAWQWLIQRKPSIGGTPLEELKKGHLEKVLDAAERDFG